MRSPIIRDAVVSAITLLIISLSASTAARAATKERFIFEVSEIRFADSARSSADADVSSLTRDALLDRIRRNQRLIAAIPPDAPNPDAAPDAFRKYMRAKKLRAYRVSVEVAEFELRTDPAADHPRGKTVTCRIALRIFGETIPKKALGFTGEGSAAVKLGTGSKVRERDRLVARRDAVELAVDDAIATSLRRLDQKSETKKKAKNKKRRK